MDIDGMENMCMANWSVFGSDDSSRPLIAAKAYQAGVKAARPADLQHGGTDPEQPASFAEETREAARADLKSYRVLLTNVLILSKAYRAARKRQRGLGNPAKSDGPPDRKGGVEYVGLASDGRGVGGPGKGSGSGCAGDNKPSEGGDKWSTGNNNTSLGRPPLSKSSFPSLLTLT